MLKKSFDLHRQGRLDEAEQGYRALLATEPDNVDALFMLGVVRRQRGDAGEAERCFRRAHELAPREGDIALHLASARYQNGKHEEARQGYERALALDPNLTGAHIGLGQIAMNAGDAGAAEHHFRVALRTGEDGHALAGLGTLMIERGDFDAALRYLTRAAELVPNFALIQFLLGQAFARKGLTTFAAQAFEKALQLNPELHEAHPWLAEVLMQTGRPREAEPHYRAILGVPGYEMRAHAGLGDVARAESRFEDAAAHYRAVLAIDPRQRMPMRMLAASLAALGRNDEVVAVYDDYLALVPDDDEIRAIRGDVLALIGRVAEATADWNTLSARRPEDAEARARVASLEEKLGHLDAALAHAEAVLRARPEEVEMRLIRVRARLRSGDDAAARADLDALGGLALSDEQARARSACLGHVHDRAGEFDDAVRCFAEAQRGLPASMPPLTEPRPELRAALDEAPGPAWADAPVLLLGAPGSGVELVAALLADQPALKVLRGRASTLGREDDFNHPRFKLYCGELGDDEREALRARYLAPLAGMDVGGSTLVDWLPRWDTHLLALIRRAMPGTRLVVVGRDPRDELLNWLAFGWIGGFPCADAEASAAWLARAHAHLHFGADLAEPRRLQVSSDAVLADPSRAGAELARFVGVDALAPGAEFAAAMRSLGGLPVRFEAGRWRRYERALAAAFAPLAS
ncbi:MAG TPA: tetratricopeptide repeat protein [Dokdonella sp.]